MSPGSQVVKAPIIINTSLLACDGNNRNDFKANSKEFCKDGSPVTTDPCNDRNSYN